jgi:hypothetical protein
MQERWMTPYLSARTQIRPEEQTWLGTAFPPAPAHSTSVSGAALLGGGGLVFRPFVFVTGAAIRAPASNDAVNAVTITVDLDAIRDLRSLQAVAPGGYCLLLMHT